MTCGIGSPLKCDVFEIEPMDDTLRFHCQYRLNEKTSQYEFGRFPSPPIGMKMISADEWAQKLDQFAENVLYSNFESFSERCYRGWACAPQKDLLLALHRYFLASNDVSLSLRRSN